MSARAPIDRLALLAAFWRAQRTPHRSREALLGWQRRRLDAFVAGPLRRVPFYRDLAATTFDALPPMDKATMLAHFDRLNAAGVALTTASAVAEAAERERDFRPTLGGGITVGLSSGTSGRPGVFLVSQRERSQWAGTMLGRVLSPALRRRLLNPFARPVQVAFFLRANSNLYTTVQSRRLRFLFCDLLQPLHTHVAALHRQPPDVLVAPASVLRALAEAVGRGMLRLSPRQVLNVAEVLEPDDAAVAAAAFGVPPQQVYQATEGLLGLPCPAGRLHLHEEAVHFELEWLDVERTRAVPRLTDMSRELQAFVRYRLDDVLRMESSPCPCGRPSACIAAIEGRCDDVLWLRDRTDAVQPVFPDVLRRLFATATPTLTDYRLVQVGDEWQLAICDGEPAATLAAVQAAVRELCRAHGLVAPRLTHAAWPHEPPTSKRRRVRCQRAPKAGHRADERAP